MSSILIIEDDLEIQVLLKRALSGLDVELIATSTAKEAREKLAAQSFCLILLDISLPDQDGLAFCGELQSDEKTKSIPVVFLTGQKDVTHKVTAFALGADDYIEKPFNPLELRARVQAKLKKIGQQTDASQSIIKGRLKLDASSQRAHLLSDDGSSRLIHLTPREFKLLFYLAKNEERIFSRTQLLDAVWGDAAEVFDRTIDTHISALRKKLKPVAGYLESIPGSGYRFSSAVKSKKAA